MTAWKNKAVGEVSKKSAEENPATLLGKV